MKGLKIIRAQPSNAIDIYPLMEKAAKEGVFLDIPKERDIKNQYFRTLDELKSPYHFWFLALRGRGYLGYLHAVAIPSRWTGEVDHMLVDVVYVADHRRKNGIGKKLIEELKREAENVGIRRIEFICEDAQIEMWEKYGAKKTRNLMRVTL